MSSNDAISRAWSEVVPRSIEREAISVAIEAHGDQRYGAAPYLVHLAAVRAVVAYYGLDRPLGVAAWLRAAVEDTSLTREVVAARYGHATADLVWAVTGVGATREERVASAYAKIVALGRDAARLKLCDRIANVEASGTRSEHFKRYRAEQPGFEAMIARAVPDGDPLVEVMLARLRRALEWTTANGGAS